VAAPGSADPDAVHVEEIDGIHVVRTAGEPSPEPMSVAELGYAMATWGTATHTVLVGTDSEHAWAGLARLLDSLRPGPDTEVLLVMSGAGTGRPGRPAPAQRIADRWRVRVTAPDGIALLVPGGALFVPQDGPVPSGRTQTARPAPSGRPEPPDHPGTADRPDPRAAGGANSPTGRGWWRFSPDAEPRPVGRQLPEPPWQAEADRLCAGRPGGTVAHRVPAGVLLRPAGAPPPHPEDLSFAVPVSPNRPVVLVGAPGDETEVPPHDVVELLARLSPAVRSAVLLAPGRNVDLLPAGQLAADTFGTEVETLTGAPLMTDDPVPGTGGHKARTVLIGADGAPAWRPFVEAVACRPAAGGRAVPPRLLRWQPPLPGVGSARAGVMRLSNSWQVVAVRSGLRIVRVTGAPHLPERPVDADGPAIELGAPGEPLGRSVLPLLGRLLAGLSPEVRDRAVLHVYAECDAEQMRELSRMMAAHGIRRLRTRSPVPAGRRPGPGAPPAAAPAAAPAPPPIAPAAAPPPAQPLVRPSTPAVPGPVLPGAGPAAGRPGAPGPFTAPGR